VNILSLFFSERMALSISRCSLSIIRRSRSASRSRIRSFGMLAVYGSDKPEDIEAELRRLRILSKQPEAPRPAQ